MAETLKQEVKEVINHPDHYNSGQIETIDAIEDWGFGQGFNLGNAIKYISRANHKNDCIEDLQKAKWYVEREIGRLEKAKSSTDISNNNGEVPVVDATSSEIVVCGLRRYHTDCKLEDVDDDISDEERAGLCGARMPLGSNYQFPKITPKMFEELSEWFTTHNNSKCACANHGACGGAITFSITPTSLGDFVTAQCSICKSEYNWEEL